MIKCNLAVLMAERNLNISDLSKETGISRNTLSALYKNTGKGVQFDTLETLCHYFDISPGELLTRINFEIKVNSITAIGFDRCQCQLEIKINDESFNANLDATINRVEDEQDIDHTHEVIIHVPSKIFSKLLVIPNEYLISNFAFPLSLSVLKKLNIENIRFEPVISVHN